METFAELLTFYIRQAGITDTELARAIGVSRQTIFRWREGLTGRPNYRDDVIAIANKLRLSPEERDNLLLAGGFRPDDSGLSETEKSTPRNNEESQNATVTSLEQPVVNNQKTDTRRQSGILDKPEILIPKARKPVFYILGTLILIVAGVWLIINNLLFRGLDNNSLTATLTQTPTTNVIPAVPGEILLLVTQFDASDEGQYVTDHIISTIQRESKNNRISNIRVEEFPQTVSEPEQASQTRQANGAIMIIYGKYSSIQVTVYISTASGQTLTPIKINTGDTISIDALSFVALARISLDTHNAEQAFSFLSKARNTLDDNGKNNDSISLVIEELLAEVNSDSSN